MGRIIKNEKNGYYEITVSSDGTHSFENARQEFTDCARSRGAIDVELTEKNGEWHFVAEFDDVFKLIMFQDYMSTVVDGKADFLGLTPPAEEAARALVEAYVNMRRKAN